MTPLLEEWTFVAVKMDVAVNPNTPLNTLFTNTLSLRSSLNVSDQVSHPYKKKHAKSQFCISEFLNFWIAKLETKMLWHFGHCKYNFVRVIVYSFHWGRCLVVPSAMAGRVRKFNSVGNCLITGYREWKCGSGRERELFVRSQKGRRRIMSHLYRSKILVLQRKSIFPPFWTP
jgi:hypothetical protein